MTLDEFTERVAYWQATLSELGLAHWRIAVEEKDEVTSGPHAAACITSSHDYDKAWLEIKSDTLEEEENLDEIIVHELLHSVFRDFDKAVEVAEGWMPRNAELIFNQQVDHEREGVIERLAWLLVRLHAGT